MATTKLSIKELAVLFKKALEEFEAERTVPAAAPVRPALRVLPGGQSARKPKRPAPGGAA